MQTIDDLVIRQIVQRTVNQALGISKDPGAPIASPTPKIQPANPEPSIVARKIVAIGADHGGIDLKELLKPLIEELGFEVIDVGTYTKESVDYPDFAHETAKLVSIGKAWRGIMIDGAGIGSCIVANKVPGVRAGMAYDYSSAVNSREHNDTNVLTLGAGLIGANLAKQIVMTWLTTEFGGGRHAPRVDKITAVEKQYSK
ncbi:MAG: ribose 5-phosphate isomerase B [Anaerolineaceae bacterium]|nr:ribose 5-phosphate isomerase B [Anaerolineaceae bacterium]